MRDLADKHRVGVKALDVDVRPLDEPLGRAGGELLGITGLSSGEGFVFDFTDPGC